MAELSALVKRSMDLTPRFEHKKFVFGEVGVFGETGGGGDVTVALATAEPAVTDRKTGEAELVQELTEEEGEEEKEEATRFLLVSPLTQLAEC